MYFNLLISRKLSYLTQSHFSPILLNSKIKAFVQQGQFVQALQLYSRNSHFALVTTKFIYPSLLKACASLFNLYYGKTIHSTIISVGLQFDPYIATSLISMYVKCGSLSDAVQVFYKMSESEVSVCDVTIWNSIIDGYFRCGYIKEGIGQFRRMQSTGLRPDAYSLCILLGVKYNLLGYMEGKQIHGYIVRNMFNGDPFLETALIDMYLSCGKHEDVWRVFDKLEDKNNVVAWNVMTGGFNENGLWEYSLELYSLAKNENVKLASASFSTVLSACCHGEDVGFGRQVHTDVIKMGFQEDPYVCTSLLTMYAKGKLVEDAQNVFRQIPDKEIELWNAMISAFVGNGSAYESLGFYNQMRLSGISSDSFTMSHILSSCGMIGMYDFGRMVHAELIKRPLQGHIAVQSALLTMYFKCGSNEEANLVFSAMKERDVVAWGSIISGFCQNKKFNEALDFFRAMKADGVKPDSDVMASVIGACTGLENVDLGCSIHGIVIKSGSELDVFVASSLIDMYSKCGFPAMAEVVFSGMPHKNLVAWNSMITCYCRNGLPDLSISLLPRILQHNLYPDHVSITSVLVAVSSVAALLKGKTVHACLQRLEISSDLQVENALIDMYIKCGCLKYAQYAFQNMPQRNLVTWNSMITGFGSHGECHKALGLFNEMNRSGIMPDDVTFLSLISCCNHSGFVEEGLNLFQSMKRDYGIEPKMEHYADIVDLLGRAGRVNDAYSFVKNMPVEPDKSVWLCLLCACRAHQDVELGELAAHNLLKMEPSRSSNYIQLLNLYGEAELWDRAADLWASMKDRGLKKSPGCSWIEVKNRVDVFFSGDSSSPKTVEIYETLSSLRRNMKRKGGNHKSVEPF